MSMVCELFSDLLADLEMRPGAVDGWLMRIDSIAAQWPDWDSVLVPDEIVRMRRFVREEDRLRSGISRAVLRRCLGAYLKVPPARLSFASNAFGRPILSDVGSQLRFSVSHSGDRVLLGFSKRRPLGVDVEQIREERNMDDLSPWILSAAEVRQLADCHSEARFREMHRAWVVKEAYLKALGVGLGRSPQKVEIVSSPTIAGAGCSTGYQLRVRGAWSTHVLTELDGYAAAIVCLGADVAVRLRYV